MADYEKIKATVGALDEEALLELVETAMGEGAKAEDILEACQQGMNIVGKMFEEGEYFVSDLIFAGEIMTQAVEILKPALAGGGSSGVANKMILCTVEGDLHDIGKNIVRSMMEAAGFEVLDLGIDVPPATIVKAAKDGNIKIIALSGVLTLAIDSMKSTVDAFVAAGMRDDVHIIIGGAPITKQVADLVGSDAWAHSPQYGVNICRQWAAEE